MSAVDQRARSFSQENADGASWSRSCTRAGASRTEYFGAQQSVTHGARRSTATARPSGGVHDETNGLSRVRTRNPRRSGGRGACHCCSRIRDGAIDTLQYPEHRYRGEGQRLFRIRLPGPGAWIRRCGEAVRLQPTFPRGRGARTSKSASTSPSITAATSRIRRASRTSSPTSNGSSSTTTPSGLAASAGVGGEYPAQQPGRTGHVELYLRQRQQERFRRPKAPG